VGCVGWEGQMTQVVKKLGWSHVNAKPCQVKDASPDC